MIEPRRTSNISIRNIQSNLTRMDGTSSGPSRLTPFHLLTEGSKVKCNRQYPECSRCSRLGYQCTYRNRMSHRASQAAIISRLEERVRDAEARLALQSGSSSDEGLVHVPNSHSSQSHSQPTISPSSTTNSHGAAPTFAPEKGLSIDHPHRSTLPDFDLDSLDSTSYNAIFDQIQITDMEVEDQITEWQTYIDPLPIPASQAQLTSSMSLTSQDLSYLHQVFFDSYFTVIPILAKDRFYRELRLYPDSVAVKSVAYSVALLAITISDSHKHLESACYTKTRRYIDDCDIEEVTGPSSSINLLQSLLFLTRYEVSKQKCARSYLTLARASHLVKMMRLDQMDKGGSSPTVTNTAPYISLPETHDGIKLEERRRCFWAWYLLEGYSGVHTGRPAMQDDTTIFVSLPSLGNLDSNSEHLPMPYLTETNLLSGSDMLSPFAGAVLVVSVVRKVLDHSWLCTQLGRQEEPSGFWDRHYSLLKHLDTFHALLEPFSATLIHRHPLVFDLQLLFNGAEIHFWEAALNEGEKRGLPSAINEESANRLLDVAQKTAGTVCSTWSRHQDVINTLSLSGAFVAWPVCSALKVLRTSLLNCDESSTRANMIQGLSAALETIEQPGGAWHRSLSKAQL
ncbi:unnamed protein product [Clonostachys rosea]|uniref:Xylanolytic transcriptional activator regulatory domain-containing protein n=1 Tax=Bionectria ochroleuca TaxID=29856 RepID=A0ABY6UYI4_BIOOC|nr:unnamed protein product [Clonostachys rosea]